MEIFADKALATRLERTEGAVNASFVETRARSFPERRAEWAEIAGTLAMFDGAGSPMTQTFGLGMIAPPTPDDLAALEAFFFERGADVDHEVSPLAGAATFALLAERGYRPIELSNVLVQSLAAAPIATGALVARRASPSEEDAWVETSVRGWSASAEFAALIRELATLSFRNPKMTSFAVERDGALIATGSLGIHDGVALFAGASTAPEERGHGAQKALLRARLDEARACRCDVAMMAAEPGSTSQRNAERNAFRVAYTRTKWRLLRAAAR
jgi:hypothetical protein